MDKLVWQRAQRQGKATFYRCNNPRVLIWRIDGRYQVWVDDKRRSEEYTLTLAKYAAQSFIDSPLRASTYNREAPETEAQRRERERHYWSWHEGCGYRPERFEDQCEREETFAEWYGK